MSSRKTTLALFLAFMVPSALLMSLQQDGTDHTPPTNMILYGYYAGDGPLEIVGSAAAVSIVEARCLVRGLLNVCNWLGGDGLYTYNVMLQFVAVWAALCTIYLAAVRLMTPAQACAAVLLAIVFVPWGFLSISYSVSWPYDLPSLFFVSLGMWAIISRRFAAFAVAIVLGTLNKETVVFLLPAYVLAEWPLLPRKTLFTRALILAGLFLATYEIPRMILAGNHLPVMTASSMDNDIPRWKINVEYLLLARRSTTFENIYWIMSLHVLPLVRLFTLPRPLRAMYYAVPVLLVPIFIYGNIYEFRLYNEIIPLGAISTVFACSRLLKTPADGAPVPAATVPAASQPTVP